MICYNKSAMPNSREAELGMAHDLPVGIEEAEERQRNL